MAKREIVTHSPEETIEHGRKIGAALKPPALILLSGDLGAGKTTLTKGIVHGLGAASEEEVTSPTFTLAHFYPLGRGTILHVDAYRLSGVREYRDLGLDDYLEDSIALIEWGEKIAADFSCHLMVEFQGDPSAPDLRVIAFSSGCPRWSPVIDALRSAC